MDTIETQKSFYVAHTYTKVLNIYIWIKWGRMIETICRLSRWNISTLHVRLCGNLIKNPISDRRGKTASSESESRVQITVCNFLGHHRSYIRLLTGVEQCLKIFLIFVDTSSNKHRLYVEDCVKWNENFSFTILRQIVSVNSREMLIIDNNCELFRWGEGSSCARPDDAREQQLMFVDREQGEMGRSTNEKWRREIAALESIHKK